MRWVELCAGSAAVTLSFYNKKPLVSYTGSKAGYAHKIREIAGIVAIPDEIILNDKGTWGII